MNSECFCANKQYIIVAITDVYSIETYCAFSDHILDLIRKDLTEENGYRSYVVYQLIDDTYCDIERWTANERKEVKK